MAYNKEEVLQKALQIIEDEQLTRISEVICFLPISRSTFYEWELDKSDEIAQKIEETKVRIKVKMKRSWVGSKIPALEIAAMKLIADEEETEALSTSKVKQDNTHSFKDKPSINLIVGKGYNTNESSS